MTGLSDKMIHEAKPAGILIEPAISANKSGGCFGAAAAC
jgi:hypothetical protein